MKNKINFFAIISACFILFFAIKTEVQAAGSLGFGNTCSSNAVCASNCCDKGGSGCTGAGMNCMTATSKLGFGNTCSSNDVCESNCCDKGGSGCTGAGMNCIGSADVATCASVSGICKPNNCDTVNGESVIVGSCSTTTDKCCKAADSLEGPKGGLTLPTDTGLSDKTIQQILTNFLNWLLMIVGIIALIGFAISGVQYILSAGEEKAMETAKRNALYSVMGVVVVLSGYVIIKAIDAALTATTTSF